MAKWSDSEIYQQTRGTNRFTRFVGWLNNLMNPGHSWVSDWNQFSRDTSPSEDIINQVTKQALTGADREANAFSAQEAQKQRDWEQMMSDTAYQRQAADMRAAGVNPALMMSGGSSGASTPSGSVASSVSPSGPGMSMSDMMQAFLLPMNKKILEAQASNIDADTEKKRAETEESKQRAENLGLVNAYYPTVTEASLDETLSRIGVNISTINSNDAKTALTNVQRLIANKENKYADQYYKARAEYEEAHTQEAKDSAVAHAAQALMTGYEYEYARKNKAKLSSSSILAICSAIGSFTGADGESFAETLKKIFKEHIYDPDQPGWMEQQYDRFKRWRDRPKRVF